MSFCLNSTQTPTMVCVTIHKTLIFYEPLLMTKYCVVRECENILHRYLYVCEVAFVILKGISSFKFHKRNLEISLRDFTSSSLLLILRPDNQSIDALSLCICKAQCQQSSQTFSQDPSQPKRHSGHLH